MAAGWLGSRSLGVIAALLAALGLTAPPAVAGATTVDRGAGAPLALTVDDLSAPVGLGQGDIYFGWHVDDYRPGAVQTAYRIVVSRPVLAGRFRGMAAVVWDSGKVPSADQAFVPYGGPPLGPDTTYRWTVRTWDGSGAAGSWAVPATFDTGLGDGDWHADWVKRVTVEPAESPTTFGLQSDFGVWANKDEYTYVRKEARLAPAPIVRARAYVSADQQYELYVNGRLAGKGEAYQFPDSQYYETQDITGLLKAGAANAFGIIYNWQGPGKGRAAGTPGVIAHISVLHEDGTSEIITTDGTWKVLPGAWLPGTQRDEEGDPVDYTENIDGPAVPVGWDRPGYLDVGWAPATVIGAHPVSPWIHLVPVRTRITYERIHAVSLRVLASGAVVADFGKVYAGIPTVTFRHGVPGHLVAMHAGFLLDQGSGAVSTTRGTQHTDMSYSYVQRGGTETFRPFDYLGFRYLQLDDPRESVAPADVSILARHVAVPDPNAGTFTSSDPTVDAVFRLAGHSALYTMQEQFVDTPTREKGSWLGDAHNESEAAMAAFGDVNETRKSLFEFAQSQARYWPGGAINKLYPTSLGAQTIPEGTEMYVDWVWQYWMRTGDRAALGALYAPVTRVSDYLWRSVDPRDGLVTNLSGASDAFQFPVDTQLNLLAVNAFREVGEMAGVLGRPSGEVARQATRAAVVTSGINAHLVGADGLYLVGRQADGTPVTTPPTVLNGATRQSDNAYALQFGVVPPARAGLVDRYVAGQGMATPPIYAGDLLQGLRAAGDDRAILHLLTDASEPGWANILARGGTFGWEVWNPDDRDVVVGGTPLGSLAGNGDSMSHGFSSNVLVAIQEALLGVVPASPGFATFDVVPPVHVLTYASGRVPTPHGPIAVRWSRPAGPTGPLEVAVTVPPNTSATVRVQARALTRVEADGLPVTAANTGVHAVMTGAFASVTLGAGFHRVTTTGAMEPARPSVATGRAVPTTGPVGRQGGPVVPPPAVPVVHRSRLPRGVLVAGAALGLVLVSTAIGWRRIRAAPG